MKTQHNYQPEDIEALLAEKSFRELYEEEKRFVLEHLASQEEYEQMRETLLAIRGAAGEDESTETLRPAPRVKEELMAAFEKERKRRVALWWSNVGYRLRDLVRFDLPVVRYGFAAVALLLVVWTVVRFNSENNSEMLVASGNPPQVPGVFYRPLIEQVPFSEQETIAVDVSKNAPPVNTQPDYTPVVVQQQPQQPEVVQPQQPEKQQEIATQQQTPVVVNFDSNDSSANGWVWEYKDSAKAVAAVTNGAANVPHDSVALTQVTTVNACCASTSVTVNGTTNAGTMTYSWTPASTPNNSYYSLSPNVLPNGNYSLTTANATLPASTVTLTLPDSRDGSRPLSADAKAISLFYGLK